MESLKLLKKLEVKVDQLWQIAAYDACGRNVQAVANIQCDIHRLFNELKSSLEGEQNYASKIN